MSTSSSTRRVARRPRRDASINVRISTETRDLIDSAAAASGKTRSEFMLESARQRAIDVMLDRRLLALDGASYAKFVRVLDNPPSPPEKLRKLFAAKAPWES